MNIADALYSLKYLGV